MKIAVVILNWNGRELLQEFLPSVVSYSKEAQVYVADNASEDDSVAYVQKEFPSVRIIQNKVNGGYAKGYNDALADLKEDVFILLNSDVEVCKNWLSPIITHLKQNPQTAILQPKILDYKNRDYFEYSGAAGGFIDELGYPFCRGRIFNTIEEDKGQYEDEARIFWASGACLVVRSQVFKELGGLDEDYFAHQEEIDFCWRAHNAGYKTMYIPQSRVYHLGGATLSVMSPKKTFLNFRNTLFNLLKNVSGIKAYLFIFLRLCLDALAGVRFIFEGKPRHTWAVVISHFSFYKYFFRIKKKRIKGKKPSPYFKTKSIVWEYFVKKKKYFHQL